MEPLTQEKLAMMEMLLSVMDAQIVILILDTLVLEPLQFVLTLITEETEYSRLEKHEMMETYCPTMAERTHANSHQAGLETLHLLMSALKSVVMATISENLDEMTTTLFT